MKQRNSAFELLRILSMVLIIAHHFSVHGGFFFHSRSLTANMLFLQLLSIGGKIGVNLFVLISGYFTVVSEKWRPEKAAKLWLQILFYSLVIYLGSCAAGLTELTPMGLLYSFLPILSNQWWFASAWFVMYLLSPWLNRMLKGLSRKHYSLLLGAGAFFFCVIPVLTWLPGRIRDVLWFVWLFALAGYLRLHGTAVKRPGAAALGSFLLTFGHSTVMLFFRTRTGGTYETVYYDMYHILILVTSVLLFVAFSRLEIPGSRRINSLAEVSFGIYLIHDSNYLRYPLWQGLFRCASFRDSGWLLLYALVLTAAVYLVCGGLEALRKKLLDRYFTGLAGKLTGKRT